MSAQGDIRAEGNVVANDSRGMNPLRMPPRQPLKDSQHSAEGSVRAVDLDEGNSGRGDVFRDKHRRSPRRFEVRHEFRRTHEGEIAGLGVLDAVEPVDARVGIAYDDTVEHRSDFAHRFI
jgi:hypothetical protein